MEQPTATEHKNRLSLEKSPYLLQHADNPVDWYPWGEEAFGKARREDKPIFLSIGYSTCHWCHVMEHESFEDPETAQLLNRHFVSIKVDREERPDVDQVYMAAVQSMTGQGGWPLSAFLTPDLKPFFGGTYFPPEDRAGLPAFRTVLEKIADAWQNRRSEIQKAGAEILEHLRRSEFAAETRVPVSRELIEKAYRALSANFDAQYGGFGSAPKFPQATALHLLMRHYVASRRGHALDMVKKTLDEMASSGIYDHIGGGFHRYAVDARWLVPHFEKMLYDNALLARTYAEAYQLTGEQMCARVARETLEYALRDMTSQEGAFHSAEDADSEGEEGRFYTWTQDEIRAILDDQDARLAMLHYGVSKEGNSEGGRSILHVVFPLKGAAREVGIPVPEAEKAIDRIRGALFEARSKRRRPDRDDKVLTAWNGLMISAMAVGFQALGDARFLDAARASARFVLKHLKSDSGLLRRYREGEVAFPAYLDDYAFLIAGLTDLYESDFDPAWLKEALRLNSEMLEKFWDEEEGGFFYSQAGDESLIVRSKEVYDGSLPSANAVAALNLLRLSEFTGDKVLRSRAEQTLRFFRGAMEKAPAAFAGMAAAVDFMLGPPKEIVIAGSADSPDTREMLGAVRRRFYPNKVVALMDRRIPQEARSHILLLVGKRAIRGKATAYVCQDFVCRRPTLEPAELEAALHPGPEGS